MSANSSGWSRKRLGVIRDAQRFPHEKAPKAIYNYYADYNSTLSFPKVSEYRSYVRSHKTSWYIFQIFTKKMLPF